jgi:hypothetical protein
MAKRILRGDAPPQAQQWRISPPLDEGTVRLRIGNKTLEFAGWSATAIAAAWNASRWPEFSSVSAAASGTDLVLTAKTAGEPFFVWITVGDSAPGAGVNEQQTIYLINSPDGGTFNIAFEGDGVDVASNITGANLQTALEGLSTLEVGDVTVTGPAGGPWVCTFGGRFAGEDVPALVVDGTNLTGGNAAASIQTIQNGGGAGDPASVTRPLAEWIGITQNVGGGSPQLAAEARFGYRTSPTALLDHLLLQFTLNLSRGTNVTDAEVTIDLGFTEIPHHLVGVVWIEDADNPVLPQDGADAWGRPLAAPFAAIDIEPGYQLNQQVLIGDLGPLISAVINRPGWQSGNRLHLHLRANAQSTGSFNFSSVFGGTGYGVVALHVDYTTAQKEIQTVTLAGGPRAGDVELTLDGDTTAPLAWNSSAAAVQAALQALTTVGSGNVQCTGGPWPSTIICAFDVSLGDLPQMTATDTLVNGSVQVATDTHGGPAIDVQVVQRSRGPTHFDDPLNWQDETGAFGLPETGDELHCASGRTELLYGLRQKSAFVVDAATNRLQVDPQCALRDGQKVRVVNAGGGLPSGLAAETDYFVRDRTGSSLRLAATLGGAAIDVTTAGTGVHTVGVLFDLIETSGRWTGKLGLPRRNTREYEEYRPRFLEAWATRTRLGLGDGSGSARTHLDQSGLPALLEVHSSAGGQGAPAVQWLGDGAGTALEVLGGELGVAIDPDQVAAFDTLKVRSGSVEIGRGVAVGDIERTGGSVRLLGPAVDGTVHL